MRNKQLLNFGELLRALLKGYNYDMESPIFSRI